MIEKVFVNAALTMQTRASLGSGKQFFGDG